MTITSVWFRLRPSLVKPALVLAGLTVGFLTLAASEKPHFESKGLDGAITVDGKFDDWYGNLQPFGGDPVAIQFLNDGQFLYVRVTASDSATRMEIMRMGMTVWFDPAGGTKKKFGIRYPVVEHGQGPDGEGDGRGRSGGGGYGGARTHRGDGPPPEEPDSPSDRVDIIGPGKDDARSLTREHLSGVDVAVRTEQGTLQYELKVPLAKSEDHPYAIETAPGKTIGVGLETGKAPHPSPMGGRGGMGGGGGGGMGGMGGGGRGRGGGGMGRGGGGGGGQHGGYEPAKPLKGWGTVTIGPAR